MGKITGNEPINPTIWDDAYNPSFIRDNDGLTIRQHFAAMAMQGILSANSEYLFGNVNFPISSEVSRLSVEMADALINELNKDKP